MLFVIALFIIVAITLLTPKEPDLVLESFYIRCRPPAGWKKFISSKPHLPPGNATLRNQVIDSILGITACLGMAMATNAIFVKNQIITIAGLSCMLIFGFLLILRSLMRPKHPVK
jgi:hypothetical protein